MNHSSEPLSLRSGETSLWPGQTKLSGLRCFIKIGWKPIQTFWEAWMVSDAEP